MSEEKLPRIKSELTHEQEVALTHPGPSAEQMERLKTRIEQLEAKETKHDGTSKNYKVTSSRWDIPEHIIGQFTASNDEEAKNRFERFKNDPSNCWNWLTLIQYYEERIVDTWQKR